MGLQGRCAFTIAGYQSHRYYYCPGDRQLHTTAIVCLGCILDLGHQCLMHQTQCHLAVACRLECCPPVSCHLHYLHL